MWCFLNKFRCVYSYNCDGFSFDIAATAREEDIEQDKGEENQDMEEEQHFLKTRGKRIKTVASKKKR